MSVIELDQQIKQLFAYAELQRLQRLEEANVGFTFQEDDLYLRLAAEALALVQEDDLGEFQSDLLVCAQAFERLASAEFACVNRQSAGQMGAALYWLAGYSANAIVLASALQARRQELSSLQDVLTAFMARVPFRGIPLRVDSIVTRLRRYVRTGVATDLEQAVSEVTGRTEQALVDGDAEEYMAGVLLTHLLRRFGAISLWGSIAGRTSAPLSAWRRYASVLVTARRPVLDLWPSQRKAIATGLLDGTSSLVLKMPTSAGKTKMTELAFVNDIFTDDKRCLYLAPFRALVSEIEGSLGSTLAALGAPVASLYGSSDANPMEVELAERARVVIATPEKMAAVLRLSGATLSQFDTIVLDEGHLLGSQSRGVAFELQLAALQSDLMTIEASLRPRLIFLSAVLPNASEIAEWLGGSADRLAEEDWQPTTTRVGVLTWAKKAVAARLAFGSDAGQPDAPSFFVPRVLQEQRLYVTNPRTGNPNLRRFPRRNNQGTIAAALALNYAERGSVLVYARRRDWAESIGEAVLERLELDNQYEHTLLRTENVEAVREVAEFLERRLGEESVVARMARAGIGLHHGTIPQSVRLVVEDAFRDEVLRLLVATNTVAQGVNFPAKTVVVHSLPEGDAPVRDFWNLAGRAGRATQETEGELIVLRTGSLSPARLRSYLNRARMEPARSQILALVEALLENYPTVSQQAIDALLTADEGTKWRPSLDAIDTHLVELMAEDLDDLNAERFERLVDNLLGIRQATSGAAAGAGADTAGAVRDLMRLRRDRMLALVPEAARRRRFAKAGVPAGAAIALDSAVPDLRDWLLGDPQFGVEAIRRIVDVCCGTDEMHEEDPEILTTLAHEWVSTGSYLAVRQRVPSAFNSLDEAVKYVEETLSYRLTWILNGLVRLLAPDEEAPDSLPEWLRLLPQFLRYGVVGRELVWVMSLGIPDPSFAAWIIAKARDMGGDVASFRGLVNWLLEHRATLIEAAARDWPRYFKKALKEVLDRYEVLTQALGDEATA